MKLSTHTIIVDDYPQQGEHLLYHTRTQALIKVHQELKELLLNLDKASEAKKHKYQDNLKYLYQSGIVINDESEDINRLRQHMRQLKYGYDQSSYGVTILTTYACNLKCVYCFEESTRTTVKMNFETQDQVVRWLKKRLVRLGYKRLFINYYGGEPLLNPNAIENISAEMQSWCRDQHMGFNFSIQTNGYLLTAEKVNRFKELGLIRVRVSLDGVGEDHDRTRPLRGGGGSFDRIMKNIVDCAGKVEIALSMGYSNNDIQPIEKLLDHLEDLGILHKLGGQFLFSPIIPTVGPKGDAGLIQGAACMCNSEDQALSDAARKIESLMKRKGLPSKSGMSTSTCPLIRENGSSTIDQEGRIYRCNSLLGHPEFAVGDVFHEEYKPKHQEFRDLDVWKQCPTDCTYLPMCSGGCRLMSFVGGNKNFKVPSCKKPYLNEMAPEFIKRDYDRMVEQKNETLKQRQMKMTTV